MITKPQICAAICTAMAIIIIPLFLGFLFWGLITLNDLLMASIGPPPAWFVILIWGTVAVIIVTGLYLFFLKRCKR